MLTPRMSAFAMRSASLTQRSMSQAGMIGIGISRWLVEVNRSTAVSL